ncbi:MAG: CapA family protein [Hallerella sp.]|uniref:CapA family protein n=1 Tax=Hallerella sp. TaxID=2815812 RepID=UPI0025843EDA|nr:CapA family protein [Hallerella sp.]MCI5600487.1 CapA family protein [Hallerella sp.]
MKKRQFVIWNLTLASFFFTLAFVACSGTPKNQAAIDLPAEIPAPKDSSQNLSADSSPKIEAEKAPILSDTSTVSFFAIGDVLFHTPLFKACKEDSLKCNFDYVFAPWKEEIQSADIAAVNQETVFVPRSEGYASYPSFGSPEEVGIAEANAGFDLITHATNHTIDRGASAVDYTIAFWKNQPATALGIHATEAERDSVFVLEKNGIRFAFVNFTYGLNGQKLPANRPYLVDLLDSAGAWKAQVEKAEAHGDVTIAFMHFGTEYTELPTKEAMAQAETAIDAGADILVCAHPHVIEPFGIYTTKAGNSALVYWSLGNFISNQQQIETNLGGVAKFSVRKIQTGEISQFEIAQATFDASVTQQEVGNYHAVPLEAYTDSMANRHLLKAKIPELSLESFQKVFAKTLGKAEKCDTKNPAEILPLRITNLSKKLN